MTGVVRHDLATTFFFFLITRHKRHMDVCTCKCTNDGRGKTMKYCGGMGGRNVEGIVNGGGGKILSLTISRTKS